MELFPSQLLKLVSPSDAFIVRSLRRDDYFKGYMSVLGQLTQVGGMSEELFEKRFQSMQRVNQVRGTYYCIVVEHLMRREIVGCATLLVEQKFIRGAALAGHVEDVVSDGSVRGKGVGRLLTDTLLQLARDVGCYKVILDCDDKNVPFYEKSGLKVKERQMVIYLDKLKAKL